MPTIRPPWMRPMGNKRSYGLQAVRSAGHAKFYGLKIVFNRHNPRYGEALDNGRLFVEIFVQISAGRTHSGLRVFETTPQGNKVLDTVYINPEGGILRDGQVLSVEGRVVNVHGGERSLAAEKIFTGLGPVPLQAIKKQHVPPPDLWAWPEELPLRPDVFVDDKRIAASYVLQLAEESRFQADRLAVSRRDNKLVITSDGECLGIMPDTDAGTGRQRIYPAKEAPVLNYGPHYESLIDRKLLESDEKRLADLFLYNVEGFRRSFKLLDLYARDYFSRRLMASFKTVKLVNLWLEGVSLIEKDSWYLPEEKELLLGAPCPISAARMAKNGIEDTLAGTVKLSQRVGDFSDRQFAVVAILYREAAKKNMEETLLPEFLLSVRRQYYSGRG